MDQHVAPVMARHIASPICCQLGEKVLMNWVAEHKTASESHTMIVGVETADMRTAAEALASSKCVELPKQASNGNAHQERFDRISRVAEIEDVQAPHELPVAPLCIKNPRDYYDSQQVNATKQEAGMKQIVNLMQRMICRQAQPVSGHT
ncbi:hypothetical protein CTI12_AA385370 [Artemisia annua]|uniref:Uncharacterized protein n=1 Tax=Artemisia annua TaxID=35608 RepID=A0A2U1MGP9_ARTAN|nr:hypothetical protein CTI12_AA385370 [Artemisia annua]